MHQVPDSKVSSLLVDFENKVEASTFLSDGKVLVKLANRFMVFTPEGQFIDHVAF